MKRLVIPVLIVLSFHVRAQQHQTADRDAAFDQIIELVSENLETENLDFTTLLEDLNYFYDHPINLNRTDREELRRLVLLSELEVEAILRHREATGRIMTELELQGIEALDMETIAAILPFIKVTGSVDDTRITWAGIKQEGSHEAFIRYQRSLEEMEGYLPIDDSTLAASPNRRYVGSPERIYARYRFRYLKNISAGITMEKDAGEAFFGPTQPYGFDYYSAHLYVGERGILKQAIIGDYQAQFGQGLTFWSGLAFGKSANISSIKRSPRAITPYVSADENNFLRGAATTLTFGMLEVTTFASYKRIDANVTSSDSISLDDRQLQSEFSSFQLSGVHGTPGQLEDRKAISELNGGGHVRFKRDGLQLGVTGVYTQYGGIYNPSRQMYQKFEPTENPFVVGGFDYQFVYKNILAFGENALRLDGGSAFLNGAIISLDRSLDIALLHRDYSPNFSTPKSNAIGESSRNSNESGLYLGTTAKMGPKWKLTGYYDLFRFSWLSYRVDAPSEGQEYLAQLEYRPSKRLKIYARYRFEHKLRNNSDELEVTTPLGSIERSWYRLNGQYDVSESVSIRSRVELTKVRLPTGIEEQGVLFYNDFIWKPSWPAKYQLKLRYALFDTESYQSRIYAYEHDVLYSFSVPAYYGRGSRAYLIFGYDLSRWSDFTLRIAQTFYTNRSTNGSGLNEINAPTRTEIKAQLRLKF